MSDPYVEFPWDNIVVVHWADDDGPPGFIPPYCGSYGWGTIIEMGPSFITAMPYGPRQYAPFVGTFSTTKDITGPEGERYGHLVGSPIPPTTMITAGGGLAMVSPYLDGNSLHFTNNQLGFMQPVGQIGWRTPMAEGDATAPPHLPMVIKNYTFNMEWFSSNLATDEFGIAFSHPRPGVSGALPHPTEPAIILGTGGAGSGTYTYDFKYYQWAHGEIIVTEENQFDPNLGGPAWLWWMHRRRNANGTPSGWLAQNYFMGSTQVLEGDWYTWEIIAECQPQPSHP